MLTCADLFAGAGGLSLGFAQAGFDVVWGGEANVRAAATFAAANPGAVVLTAYLTGDEVPDVDVVIGGPPCQPFSSAGMYLGEYDARDGIPAFLRALDVVRPRAFVFEEVPTLLSQRHRGYYARVRDDLERAGYAVTHEVLDAADYGVAQRRARLFTVGFSHEDAAQRFRWPAPQPRVTVREALADLVPWYGPGETRHSRAVLLDAPLPGARIVDAGRGGTRKGGSRAKSLLYKLTRPETQTDTITVSNETKGSEHALRIVVEWDGGTFERRLGLLELARLQGFPEGYPWQGHARDIERQIGNAVSPPVARALAAQVRRALRQ